MKTLLEKTRDINRMVQKNAASPINFMELARILSGGIVANIYILGRKGKILGHCFNSDFVCDVMSDLVKDEHKFPPKYNEELLQNDFTSVNIKRNGICTFVADRRCRLSDKFTSFVPVIGGGERLGTIVLSKSGEFTDEDLLLAEYGATLIGMEIIRAKTEKIEVIARQKAAVSIAIDTLSYSELEAVENIFNEMKSDHGLLVASKIADKVGITRSVIVNALRKLESAGVIEVRSLGMKGTYIRIKNDYLLDELEKLKLLHQK